MLYANISEDYDDLFDSIIEYTCPECGELYSLEPDTGTIKCICGVDLVCDIMECIWK